MPKARQTCTRCSMRRQKCDRGTPCSRCVVAGVGSSCTTVWKNGYDPAIHRQYLRSKPSNPKSPTAASRPPASAPPKNQYDTATQLPHQPLRSPANIVDWSAHDDIPDDDIRVASSSGGYNTLTPACPVSNESYSGGRSLDIRRLQILLPSTVQARMLIDYHSANISWYHHCVSAYGFSKEFSQALGTAGIVRLDTLDPRWAALLFAIFCSSLTCADNSTAAVWGFNDQQKRVLSDSWFDASISCLNLGKWLARPHLNSIQTVCVLSTAAHVLGHSAELFTLFGIAIRLAQTLGMQSLSYKEELDSLENMTDNRREMVLKREVQRRAWTQLYQHDSNSTVSTRMRLLQPRYITTAFARRIQDESLTMIAESIPTFTDWAAWMSGIADVIAECNDAMFSSRIDSERYQKILSLDAQLRSLVLPQIFDSQDNTPWVKWAKQESIIIRANKIGFIHRNFLGQSFHDERYAYSRWASITAARTVIHTVDEAHASDATRPVIWNDQAHTVGACITLCLDNHHRSGDDREAIENTRLLDRGLRLLHSKEDSYLAVSGARLIRSLRRGDPSKLKRALAHPADQQEVSWPLESRDAIDDILQSDAAKGAGFEGSVPENVVPTPQQSSEGDAMDLEIGPDDDVLGDLSWIDLFTDNFSAENGLENLFMGGTMFKQSNS